MKTIGASPLKSHEDSADSADVVKGPISDVDAVLAELAARRGVDGQK
jgi:hypothetical protein